MQSRFLFGLVGALLYVGAVRRPIEWVEKLPDAVKRKVRVTLSPRRIKWQFQLSTEERWNYDASPSLADWNRLVDEVEQRYHRRRFSYEDLQFVKKCRETDFQK